MHYKASEISYNFLINFYLNDRKGHIINNTPLNKFEACINKILNKNSTYIIETEINHWVTVTITENRLFYIQKEECEICLSNNVIIQFAKENNLDIVLQQWDTPTSDCLIYPLFFTLHMLSVNSSTDPTKVIIDLCSLNKFREEFNKCKSQFEKIKEKIKVCTNLFSEIKDEVSVITDYKHALYFIYFVESIALQDVGLKNEELKRYIIQTTINEKNVEIVKKIRFWLLHREKSYFVFPQQLHKFTFQEKDSRKIFKDLGKYLQCVYHKLCGEEEDEPEKQPFSILCHSEDFGNKLEKENVGHILEDLSCEFIKEGFSLKKLKNPEETLFNFIANFIPLLKLIYKIEGETFKPLIDFRNQFIHNIYILYQNGQDVPYIAFQSQLYKTKELLLKFNFCSKVTRELKSISNTDGWQKPTAKVNECLQRFKNLFSEELKSSTQKDSLKNQKKAVNYLVKKIEQYFRSIFMVDIFNSITLSNIKIEKFNLPLNYNRFSEENKQLMFRNFNTIRTINESTDLSEDARKHIDEIIKNDLKSLGLSESEYENIRSSVLNAQYFDNEKLVKEICKHILNIKELKRRSEFDMTTIIKDYYMYLENKPEFSFEKYKKITLEQFTEIEFEINIIDGSFYMPLSNILKNFIPLYFNISPNYTCFETVESIFQDKEVLHIISCSNLDMQNVMTQIYTSPLLAPLCVEILCTQKLKLESNEERNIVFTLTHNLLRYDNNNGFLHRLFSFKIKDKKLIEDCFDKMMYVVVIFAFPEKLQIFFSFPVIQERLISILKSDLCKREHESNILISFLNYQYDSAYKLYKQKNFKEALDLVDSRRAGLSLFLAEVVDKNILQNDIRYFEIKFLIAKIKFVNGIKDQYKQNNDSLRYFSSSLKILNASLTKILNSNIIRKDIIFQWQLRIRVLKARILHLMGECKQSSDEYKNIFLNLYNINKKLDTESLRNLFLDNLGFINSIKSSTYLGDEIKQLFRTEEYRCAIQLNRRDLNISKILMYYSEELNCRMKTLNRTEDVSIYQCFYAFLSCCFCLSIQKQILKKKKKNHFIIKQTSDILLKLSEQLQDFRLRLLSH